MESISSIVTVIINRTFNLIREVYHHRYEGNKTPQHLETRLIFPRCSVSHRNGEIRVSEQELRFLFVEQFNKYCTDNNLSLGYSIETPTEYRYSFSKEEEPQKVNNGGESASIDLCIHDERLERVAMIEFKALNPKEKEFAKDFCKLREERVKYDIPTFFFLIIDGCNEGTRKSIRSKIVSKDKETIFKCYSLKLGKEVNL